MNHLDLDMGVNQTYLFIIFDQRNKPKQNRTVWTDWKATDPSALFALCVVFGLHAIWIAYLIIESVNKNIVS